MESWSFLLELVILLGSCLVAGAVLSRLRQSPLVGYLLVGMVLGGPGSLHVVRAEGDIETMAELGAALLLFSLGLEFSWTRLRRFGGRLLAGGVLQVVVTGTAVVMAGLAFGLAVREATALGAMLGLSSTAAVLRVLQERAEVDSLHGRNAVAVLLVQDMAVVPLAVLMTMLAGEGSFSSVLPGLARLLLGALVFAGGLYLVVNRILVAVLEPVFTEKHRDLPVLVAVVVGLGAAWGAHAVGVSPALGAFLAGMFLGGSRFATQVRADVASLRVVLLTLFFGAVGMVADPVWIAHNAGLVVLVAALILLGKTLITGGVLRLVGQPSGAALASGLCVAQVGEFAFVLGNAGRGTVIGEDLYRAVVSSAILTLLVTPYLVSLAPRAARRVGAVAPGRGGGEGPESFGERSPLRPDVVIVGFGPAGQAVGNALAGTSWPVVVLDLNPVGRSAAEALGFHAHTGDATQIEVLEHAGVQAARVVVITLPARSAALTVLEHVRRLAPGAYVAVRSRYQIHKSDFEIAGAHVVIGEEEVVGSRLSAEVTRWLGGDPAAPGPSPLGPEA